MANIFFDHISGTPLHPRVQEVMVNYLKEQFGNPTSQHRVGDAALEALEQAREECARLIQASPEEVIFTSGGTESINLALKGAALAPGQKKRHIISTEIEHQAVQKSLKYLARQGFQITSLPVDPQGLVDPQEVEKAITEDTFLISVMHANNEIGTIQPLAEIGRIAKNRGILLHTDAVASVGVIPFAVEELGVDLASFAANQFYGPSGVGGLYLRRKTKIRPLIEGGIQERNLRAGTPNMIGIVGMGQAALLAREEMPSRLEHFKKLRDAFKEHLNKIDAIKINGHPTLGLPNLLSFSVKYVEGEAMVLLLDERGVAMSTRSACATGSLRASHVLMAIGCDYTEAQGTLIFSCGIANTLEEVDQAFYALKESVTFLRKMSPLYRRQVDPAE
jgi:cysteine desulfurase